MNKTYYSSYDSSFSAKPTVFKSNIWLNLRKERGEIVNTRHMSHGTYDMRSAIPELLIKDVVDKCISELDKKGE